MSRGLDILGEEVSMATRKTSVEIDEELLGDG